MYGEPVSMSFTSFDGDHITVRSNGDASQVIVETNGDRSSAQAWYDRLGEGSFGPVDQSTSGLDGWQRRSRAARPLE